MTGSLRCPRSTVNVYGGFRVRIIFARPKTLLIHLRWHVALTVVKFPLVTTHKYTRETNDYIWGTCRSASAMTLTSALLNQRFRFMAFDVRKLFSDWLLLSWLYDVSFERAKPYISHDGTKYLSRQSLLNLIIEDTDAANIMINSGKIPCASFKTSFSFTISSRGWYHWRQWSNPIPIKGSDIFTLQELWLDLVWSHRWSDLTVTLEPIHGSIIVNYVTAKATLNLEQNLFYPHECIIFLKSQPMASETATVCTSNKVITRCQELYWWTDSYLRYSNIIVRAGSMETRPSVLCDGPPVGLLHVCASAARPSVLCRPCP